MNDLGLSPPGAGLNFFIQCVTHDRLYRLSSDKIWQAKTDLAYILKGVVGAQSDNVESLRAALRAAEERDWNRLELVQSDAIMDYETLMAEYEKGHLPAPRTVQSRKFSNLEDLKDLPTELISVSRATKELQRRKEEEHRAKEQERKEAERIRKEIMEEERRRKQEAEIEEEIRKQQMMEQQQQHLWERQQLHEQQLQQQQLQLHKAQQHETSAQNIERKLKSRKEDADTENIRTRFNQMKTRDRGEGDRSAMADPMQMAENLAERFTMLFETEWKAALADLNEVREGQEDGNIKLLGDIVEACFQYCKSLATEQFQEIWEKTLFPMKEVPEWLHVSKSVQKEASKVLKQYRQDTATFSVPSLQMMFTRNHLKKMLDPDRHSTSMINYTNKCIELSWLINVQNPPMCFLWARTGQKISGHLTVYSKAGDLVKFNVWPALLLHHGGRVMCKGIVQPQ